MNFKNFWDQQACKRGKGVEAADLAMTLAKRGASPMQGHSPEITNVLRKK